MRLKVYSTFPLQIDFRYSFAIFSLSIIISNNKVQDLSVGNNEKSFISRLKNLGTDDVWKIFPIVVFSENILAFIWQAVLKFELVNVCKKIAKSTIAWFCKMTSTGTVYYFAAFLLYFPCPKDAELLPG